MHSYNSYIDEPLRGINVYANYREQKTDGTTKILPYAAAAKFDFEGKFPPLIFVSWLGRLLALCAKRRSSDAVINKTPIADIDHSLLKLMSCEHMSAVPATYPALSSNRGFLST